MILDVEEHARVVDDGGVSSSTSTHPAVHPPAAGAPVTELPSETTAVPSLPLPDAPAPRSQSKHQHHHGKTAPDRAVHKKSRPQKAQKRRGSSSGVAPRSRNRSQAGPAAAAAPRPIPVADPFPERVVNPLLELPAGPGPVAAKDLQHRVTLALHPPDTYPLAYLARLLGWPLPPVAPGPDPVPWTADGLGALPLPHQRDAFGAVPPEGWFYRRVVRRGAGTRGAGAPAVDPWLRRVDPMYVALLRPRGAAAGADFTPVTATQHLKLVERLDVLDDALAVARQLGILAAPDDWTVRSLRGHYRRQERGQEEEPPPPPPPAAADPDAGPAAVVAAEAPPAARSPSTVPTTVSGFVLERDNAFRIFAEYEFRWHPLGSDYELVLFIKDLRRNDETLLTTEPMDDENQTFLLVAMALILAQARACSVWYALMDVSKPLQGYMEEYFGMTERLEYENEETASLVCDVNKSSTRLTFLKYLEKKQRSYYMEEPTSALTHRWIARLSTQSGGDSKRTGGRSLVSPTQTHAAPQKSELFFSSASAQRRTSAACVRAILPANATEHLQLLSFDRHTRNSLGPVDMSVDGEDEGGSIELMRDFDLPGSRPTNSLDDESQLCHEIMSKRDELARLEKVLEPKIRLLMEAVTEERHEYEEKREARRFLDEYKNFEEYKKALDHRKEMEKAWQEQLEQDMEAVCDVCNDGEVTPDNQILFCESCNVAVHQMCYGIDRIPDGDYYCIPCRYLGRDRVGQRRQECGAPKLVTEPLPVFCELCPRRHGAFLQSKSEDKSDHGKWVHATCAKWQGLDYVRIPDLVEDVTEIKLGFRQLRITCCLCQGARGGMNKCRVKDCKNWVHVTCARAVGFCEVVHGEDVTGKPKDNAWSLLCREHSGIPVAQISQNSVTIEYLQELASTFPPEPEPEIVPIPPMPFDKATGEERKRLLLNREYENELVLELSTKRTFGIRCEVCNGDTDNGVRLKCRTCGLVLCDGCSLDADKAEGSFRCTSCTWISIRQKSGEPFDAPHCIACFQPGGFLREAFANPITKMSYWKSHPKEFEKTLFGRPMWIHSLCAMWHPKPILLQSGKVNLSDVVMTSGRQLVRPRLGCLLCGHKTGLTVCCDHAGCHYVINGERHETAFHVTCARQAGFEVGSSDDDDEDEQHLYVKCYRHGGNEYNLRAKLEDLIEIEKSRAGSSFTKVDQPMKFSHAARLMQAAFSVIRMLSWAWRWAELWVDYESTWEVLLEPGQREEDMSKEELKIVESTRESRCVDARRCRLAALGTALRNRNYDTEDGSDYDRQSFSRAIRCVLETKSLVGPLERFEIDFYVQWLSLAYWSKSRLLGLGNDKIKVSEKLSEKDSSGKPSFCYHVADGSAKFELGKRELPGKDDTPVDEPDDFMRNPIMEDESGTKVSATKLTFSHSECNATQLGGDGGTGKIPFSQVQKIFEATPPVQEASVPSTIKGHSSTSETPVIRQKRRNKRKANDQDVEDQDAAHAAKKPGRYPNQPVTAPASSHDRLQSEKEDSSSGLQTCEDKPTQRQSRRGWKKGTPRKYFASTSEGNALGSQSSSTSDCNAQKIEESSEPAGFAEKWLIAANSSSLSVNGVVRQSKPSAEALVSLNDGTSTPSKTNMIRSSSLIQSIPLDANPERAMDVSPPLQLGLDIKNTARGSNELKQSSVISAVASTPRRRRGRPPKDAILLKEPTCSSKDDNIDSSVAVPGLSTEFDNGNSKLETPALLGEQNANLPATTTPSSEARPRRSARTPRRSSTNEAVSARIVETHREPDVDASLNGPMERSASLKIDRATNQVVETSSSKATESTTPTATENASIVGKGTSETDAVTETATVYVKRRVGWPKGKPRKPKKPDAVSDDAVKKQRTENQPSASETFISEQTQGEHDFVKVNAIATTIPLTSAPATDENLEQPKDMSAPTPSSEPANDTSGPTASASTSHPHLQPSPPPPPPLPLAPSPLPPSGRLVRRSRLARQLELDRERPSPSPPKARQPRLRAPPPDEDALPISRLVVLLREGQDDPDASEAAATATATAPASFEERCEAPDATAAADTARARARLRGKRMAASQLYS